MSETRRRRRCEHRCESARRQLARPVAEDSRRKAVTGDDDSRTLRWIGQLRLDDARQRDVTERAAPVPTLEADLGEYALRARRRIQIRKRREPLDPGDAVSAPPARVGVDEVIGEYDGVRLVESECAQPR